MGYKWKSLEERACAECGEVFMQNVPNQIFCSKKCCVTHHNREARAKEARGREERRKIAQCKECGKEFEQKVLAQRYCCEECKKKWQQRAKREQVILRGKPALFASSRKSEKNPGKEPIPKDGFTWDDIRKIQAETGMSSYHQMVEILKERRRKERGW